MLYLPVELSTGDNPKLSPLSAITTAFFGGFPLTFDTVPLIYVTSGKLTDKSVVSVAVISISSIVFVA